jgi:hypothetical protein
MTSETEKDLLLSIADEFAVEAKDRRELGGRSAVLFRNISPDDLDTISRVLREAAEGWSFDVGSIPRDDTVLVCVEPTAKNNTRKRDRSVLPAYVDEDGRICDSGTWKPDPGLQGEYWRTVAWRPLPLPPSETGK